MTGQAKSAVDTLLAEALKELAEKHPIEKITIKEITDRAGVIRPTFYNHFQDKYELLEWIIMEDLLKPMIPLIKNRMLDQAWIFLFTSIEREKTFYSKFSRLEGQNSFEVIIKGCAKSNADGTCTYDLFGGRRGGTDQIFLADPGTGRGILRTVVMLCDPYLDTGRNGGGAKETGRDL